MKVLFQSPVTEPAKCGLRLLFCLAMSLLMVACASTKPAHEEQPPPLEDHTADTDYRLETVAEKLRQAEQLEYEGQRQIASTVVGAAVEMLPADHAREREYLDVVKAAIWARKGDGRDADKANGLLDRVAKSASARGDGRLMGDVHLTRVVLKLADGDKVGAARSGDDALREFSSVKAHGQVVRSARGLAFQFSDAGESRSARSFARRAHETAQRMDDDELLLQTCLDVARVEAKADAEFESYYVAAYEAAYRLNSMGWRNVVIALAVDTHFGLDDMKACRTWGDRLRDYEEGALPTEAESGLYTADYITLMAQYSFALRKLTPDSPRRQEAIELALVSIAALSEAEQAEWQGLAEKLGAGLLQPDGEK